jgi:hypothetical protein
LQAELFDVLRGWSDRVPPPGRRPTHQVDLFLIPLPDG